MPGHKPEVGSTTPEHRRSALLGLKRRVAGWTPAPVREFLSDNQGAVAVITALVVPMLLGFAGLAIEVNYWYLEKRRLQEAADSGALAGAYEYQASSSISQVDMETAVTEAVDKSGYNALTTQTVNRPLNSGSFAVGGANEDASAVEVVLTESYDTLFVSLFGMSSVDIQTRAVAVSGGHTGSACVLSLERMLCDDPGIQLQGSLDLDLVSCSVHSNDSCGDGVLFNGNPDVLTDCLTTGGYIDGTSSNLVLSNCKDMGELVADVTDPFELVVVPNVSSETCANELGVYAFNDPRPWWQRWLISSAYAAPGGGGGGGGGAAVAAAPRRSRRADIVILRYSPATMFWNRASISSKAIFLKTAPR